MKTPIERNLFPMLADQINERGIFNVMFMVSAHRINPSYHLA